MLSETQREFTDVIRIVWPDWEIIEKLGSGAFATVFRASRKEKIAGEKDSAIKIIRIPQEDTDWDQLLAEGKSPAQTREYFQEAVDDALKEIRAMEDLGGHTNIVNIYDYKLYKVPDRNVWYILIRMEYLQKINTESFNEAEIRKLGTDVCTALSICRKKNIVHRDVSLDNIFIHDGNYKLGDFGVAKVLEGTVGGMHSIAGKPLYMAPEVYNATLTDTDMDSVARVDLYSLGILLYRLSNNMKYPFEDPESEKTTASERNEAFRRRVIDGETLPPPVNASPEMAAVILKACEANPDKRYGSAEEFRDALLALKGETKQPRFSWKKTLIIPVVLAVLACVWFFVLNPLLFPEWSEWSEWTETRQEISDPDQMQEEEKTAYKWKAQECPVCGEKNPEYNENCVSCGNMLPVEYTDDSTGQPIDEKTLGRYFSQKPYLYIGQMTRYRYRSKGQKEAPIVVKTYQITITAPEEMSDSDFRNAQEVLRKRLDLFTEGQRYGWLSEDRKIDIELPAELFSNLHAPKVLSSFLVQPTRLYAIDQASRNRHTQIPYNEIENAEYRHGAIDGMNPADYGIAATEYNYIKIVLKKEFAESHREEFSSWTRFAFAQGRKPDPNNVWILKTLSQGDGRTYYIIADGPEENLGELICFNLTQEDFTDELGCTMRLEDIIHWLDTDSNGQEEKILTDPGKINNPAALFYITGGVKFTEGDRMDAERIMRRRLDAAGIPYALGYTESLPAFEDVTNYLIKTGMTDNAYSIMHLIGVSHYITIQKGLSSVIMPLDALSCEPGKAEGSFELRINKDSSLYPILHEPLTALAEEAMKDDGWLYLYTHDKCAVFACRAEAYLEEGALAVTGLCEVSKCRIRVKPLGQYAGRMQALMSAVIQDSDYPDPILMYKYTVCAEDDGTVPSENCFAVQYNLDTDEMEKEIRLILSNASLKAEFRELTVSLHLEADDRFLTEAPDLIREIYEKLDFPSLYADKICFDLIDPQDENETAQIVFKKELSIMDFRDKVSAVVTFTGERMEPYKNAITETISNMSFYQE